MATKTRTIRVDYLARVEGEGALDLRIRDGRVRSARLNIFEPPRLFEAMLQGRGYAEVPDIVARICGICPIAYQMSAVHAIEHAFGVQIDGQLRALRRLVYCGEWIESHALHVVMLHAPDFLGFPDAIAMAREHGDAVRRGLALKKAGNALMRTLGGREIHPVNVKVGGFYRLPERTELAPLVADLERACEMAIDLVRWVASFPFPDFERDYEFVALRHAREYPFNEGRLVSSRDIDIDIDAYESKFEERHVRHSTALQSFVKRRGAYLVGPLARYALNYERLPARVRALAGEVGLGPVCRNPFRSIVVRALEIVFACDEALRLIAAYEPPEAAAVPIEPRAAVGYGCTEAPRGICWHRYEFAADGTVQSARIVPPTSQNQASMETDLAAIAAPLVDETDEVIRDRCERSIRNYDPCISCSAHFLKLTVDRT
ncbi:nickel-dependent hydrogenase large subunit (plasmid) [Burkholderia thailandensis]|uniref:Ni/Fe hydrogenase subunit alpha n=1 Tax=Burkholderia thailandensis TaxID=57975 RepID=UPI00192E028E|nr:nickel-dependent hydrogenase large subunit [Burkholderia thailandensis]MBS2132197.1 nickel-dependent hydrogenase large subunit [Burkholderia thailandensis]QRA15293.1 nickel-dependent hydrogenase large subunit [Burkholderia thailandensis]